VPQALIPIMLGHILAISAVIAALLALGIVVGDGPLQAIAGGSLILWALYHAASAGRRRWPSRQAGAFRARNRTGRSRNLRTSRPVRSRRTPKAH
jgi:hypothetical protein